VIEDVVRAIEAGRPVLLPTDTVYGLCATPASPEAAGVVSKLKGRPESQPLALLAADVDRLLELVPELEGTGSTIARVLLPGRFTLVLPNPARRYGWLAGDRPDTIGVRVPVLARDARAVLMRVGAVLATSANLSGGPDPRRLEEVPDEIRAACGAELDGGELPGLPSTVLDLTGEEPRVLREGAVPAEEALARVRTALG
jgi:L-threonylcarbamoyladenylate synthase